MASRVHSSSPFQWLVTALFHKHKSLPRCCLRRVFLITGLEYGMEWWNGKSIIVHSDIYLMWLALFNLAWTIWLGLSSHHTSCISKSSVTFLSGIYHDVTVRKWGLAKSEFPRLIRCYYRIVGNLRGRKKTFANWWKIWFMERKLSQVAWFCCAKECLAPNFAEKTFANSHKAMKFTKVFSFKGFPLYGMQQMTNNMLQTPPSSMLHK